MIETSLTKAVILTFFLEQKTKETCVVDHNLAFANDFKINEHKEQHVSSGYWNGLELVDKEIYTEKFKNALQNIDNIISDIPEEWLEMYPIDTIKTEITLVLQKFLDERFWEGIS
ncbi:HipA family kinase [Photobacterium leiognathi]|uniref:HipA family kinase n=1 Tax=Photobacterium leiognathi TaxID=553611 RepID=UPI000B2C1C50|nr:HipA family kinase [Photobacterium leiognathi]